MKFEKQVMAWAAAVTAFKDISAEEHCMRAKAYEEQADHYDELAKEARRIAEVHRRLEERS